MRIAALVITLVVLFAGSAAAQPQPPPDARPWAAGVSQEKQTLALEAYEEGNAEFVESRYAQALTKYREAIAHWDHPAIRFNMAVCLINLEQPLEARAALERALAYGDVPLGPEVHQQGLTYQKLLHGRLTHVTIRCDEPLAEVSLDGTVLFNAPGSVSVWLQPGKHQLVATKAGYLTASNTLSLAPGTIEQVDVRLYPNISTTRTTRRWKSWKPYVVVGAGVLVAGAGGIAYALAASDYDEYDAAIRAACPRGCDATESAALADVHAIKSGADTEQTAAFSMFVVGGALAVAGGVGLYLNQPRTEILAPAMMPAIMARPGGAMLGLGGRF